MHQCINELTVETTTNENEAQTLSVQKSSLCHTMCQSIKAHNAWECPEFRCEFSVFSFSVRALKFFVRFSLIETNTQTKTLIAHIIICCFCCCCCCCGCCCCLLFLYIFCFFYFFFSECISRNFDSTTNVKCRNLLILYTALHSLRCLSLSLSPSNAHRVCVYARSRSLATS